METNNMYLQRANAYAVSNVLMSMLYNELPEEIRQKLSEAIVLCDDFVGSGFNYYTDNKDDEGQYYYTDSYNPS